MSWLNRGGSSLPFTPSWESGLAQRSSLPAMLSNDNIKQAVPRETQVCAGAKHGQGTTLIAAVCYEQSSTPKLAALNLRPGISGRVTLSSSPVAERYKLESQAQVERGLFPYNNVDVSLGGHGQSSHKYIGVSKGSLNPIADNPHLRHGYAGHLGNRERRLSCDYKPAFNVQLHSENHRNPNAHQQLKVRALGLSRISSGLSGVRYVRCGR
jgi:hypothetical protein